MAVSEKYIRDTPLAPPIPRTWPPSVSFEVDADRAEFYVNPDGSLINLNKPLDEIETRNHIAKAAINIFKYEIRLIMDNFGLKPETHDHINYCYDCIAAWKNWGLSQAVYEDWSRRYLDENLREYGKII